MLRAHVALSSVCLRGRLGRSLYGIQVEARLQSPCCTLRPRFNAIVIAGHTQLALYCCQHLKLELSLPYLCPRLPEPQLCSGISRDL